MPPRNGNSFGRIEYAECPLRLLFTAIWSRLIRTKADDLKQKTPYDQGKCRGTLTCFGLGITALRLWSLWRMHEENVKMVVCRVVLLG